MIEGADMGEAARAVGMSAAAFSLALAQLGEKRGRRRRNTPGCDDRLQLFSAEGAR